MTGSRTVITRRARQASHSVRRFFDAGNLFRFVVSIILAVGLWALVTYQNDPETTRVMGGMPVTVTNIESDHELVGDPPTVDITLQGPQSIVNPLERDSVLAIADMEGIDSAGEYEVDVVIEAPSDLRVRDVVPETVRIEIDRMTSLDDVPIVITEPEDVPANLQVTSIDVRPEILTVQGPGRTVQLVEEARVDLRIAGRTATFSETVEPVLVDSEGEPIEGLTIEPSEVAVTVNLDVSGQPRDIAVGSIADD
jgi:YbbR domain-containing protein